MAKPQKPEIKEYVLGTNRDELPVLIELGLFSESDKDEFNREWRKRTRDPSAFFVTPPMIEVIGIKR